MSIRVDAYAGGQPGSIAFARRPIKSLLVHELIPLCSLSSEEQRPICMVGLYNS